MKVMTILGTRPEIIRLCRVIELLDRLCEHTLVHTGQNFDPKLNDVFFDELGVRRPDHFLGVRGDTLGDQIAQIILGSERVMRETKPDRLLLLGDTNSALASIVAKRTGVPVFHMEAGNRCYDDRVPEEVNRRIIDHSSDVLMPYTERSRQNLLREGIPGPRVFVTGNPINEVLQHYKPRVDASTALQSLGLTAGGYFLVTMHRAENVDVPERLAGLTAALDAVQREHNVPVIVSTHPRTRARMRDTAPRGDNPGVRYLEPFGFFDFVALERSAKCVLSDSGTVQEECCLLRVPNVTIRDVTERPETVECGSNMLSGADPASVQRAVRAVLAQGCDWAPPPEYVVGNVSRTVAKVVLGYDHPTATRR